MKIHIATLAAVILVAFLDIQIESLTTPDKQQIEQMTEFTVSFSGDVLQHMPQLSAARQSDGTYDFSRTFAYISELWQSVDFAVVNYETTISANGKYTGFPCFSSPPDVARALFLSGVDIAALANNHCCDKGLKGIEKTITTLDSIGFRTTGTSTNPEKAGQILILKKGKFRVALLNYTHDTNGIPVPRGAYINLIDTTRIKHDIQLARRDSAATHVLAFMHWGVEYQRKSNAYQKQIGLWCRANGVDAVIGSHPHVVQEIDTVNNIVYSLGNFISNQQDQYTDSGLTVVVRLNQNRTAVIEYTPHWCDKMVSNRREKYRVLTDRDTTLLHGASLAKMQKALKEARQAVGAANEYKF